MTLPVSGNSISLSQVNTELGRSATATINMNDSAVRSLFGKAGSGTTISMSDGLGKSSFTPSLATLTGQSFTTNYSSVGSYPVICQVQFNSDGNWYQYDNNGAQIGGVWGSPATTGIGANYWVKFTQTALTGSTGSATVTTGWLQLNNNQTFTVLKLNGGSITYSATYTVQVASDSGGANIVATATGVVLTATRV